MQNKNQNYYNLSKEKILSKLNSSLQGLTEYEAEKRLLKFGSNKLPEAKKDGLRIIFLRQFKSPLIYILLFASLIIFFTSEITDGFVILFIILFNAIVGTIQEGRAQNTLLALKKMTATKTSVIRDGREIIIPADMLVPGDIIVLREGDKIPADSRVTHSSLLKVDEAVLTGESYYKSKVSDPISGTINSPAEQSNMVFKGTYVVTGTGKAVVISTGLDTYIGQITKKASLIDSDIPLKKDIKNLSRFIIYAVSVICLLLVILGIATGNNIKEIFNVAVAVAVSVIPEGLPIVMTLVLAMGVWRMSKHKVLVKRLQAVEALGQAKIIAVDKTGTITKNELTVEEIYGNNKFFHVTGAGYEPKGEIRFEDNIVDPLNYQELLMIGRISNFCANAQVAFLEETSTWKISGDPVEAAMLVFSEKIGFRKEILENEIPKIAESPFDYKTKIHATLNMGKNENFLAVAGAPENIIAISKKIWSPHGNFELTEEKRKELDEIFSSMSRRGLRVIALAAGKTMTKTISKNELQDISFVGFLGMKDVLREESKEAVIKAQSAGIKVVMLTGDHKITARAIAEEAGIFSKKDKIIVGDQIDKMTDDDLSREIEEATVFARVTPDHKLRIIEAYKKRGEIVAMTGDGVNDALSLAAADLGVSMGNIGTEVAREASDIVLLDDNFGNIVLGIKEGKNILRTMKRVILYLFSTSAGELLTIFATFLIGYPLPILAVQILWLNLVTDGFLDMALAMEPRERGLLRKRKRDSQNNLIDKLMIQRILIMAVPMMIGTLILFSKYYEDNIFKAWTISLTTLAVFQWFNAWNCRSEDKSIFRMNPFTNIYLVGATIIVILLQLLALYAPAMQKILHTVPLNFSDWILIVSVAFAIVIFEEARKFISGFVNKFSS